MTITRTPRRWPGYNVRRRFFWGGTRRDIVHIPAVQDRDFSTIIATAKMAVEARNNPTYGPSLRQVVTLDRDVVSVDGVHPEAGKAVVFGFLGYRPARLEDIVVTMRPKTPQETAGHAPGLLR